MWEYVLIYVQICFLQYGNNSLPAVLVFIRNIDCIFAVCSINAYNLVMNIHTFLECQLYALYRLKPLSYNYIPLILKYCSLFQMFPEINHTLELSIDGGKRRYMYRFHSRRSWHLKCAWRNMLDSMRKACVIHISPRQPERVVG